MYLTSNVRNLKLNNKFFHKFSLKMLIRFRIKNNFLFIFDTFLF